MKILVAEDEPNIALAYKVFLESRNHEVFVTSDGSECIREYRVQMERFKEDSDAPFLNKTPFDVVVLDYKMPKKDGMEAAKEILALSPRQRIIFASAYVLDTLQDAVKDLDRVVEMVQKPFEMEQLVSLIEDHDIWKGLEELNTNVKELKKIGISHDALVGLLEGLKRLQKNRAL